MEKSYICVSVRIFHLWKVLHRW